MSENTVIGMFNARVYALRDKPALTTLKDKQQSARTWSQYGKEVRAVARALAAEGVGRGDAVAVLSGNRAEYPIVDLATLACGAVAVPIYHSDSPEQCKYILDNSETKVMFVEDVEQAAKIVEVRGELDKLKRVLTFTDGEADATYGELVDKGRELDTADPSAYDNACEAVSPDDRACIIYTSGTTGPPKGAILTHSNIVWTANSLMQILELDNARFLSFLPMAHVAERMVSHYCMLMTGGTTYYGGGVNTLRDDLPMARPTVFFAVPRVFEKFEAAIRDRFGELTGVQSTLADMALQVGTRVVEARQAKQSPRFLDRLLHPVLDRLVFGKLRSQLGLDSLVALVSGAAPITRETLLFFHAAGLPIAEVYGQTEDCGPTSLNPPERIKIGTVGPPIPGVDVRLGEDGEILVKGGNVFKGYMNNPEATAQTVDADGWLYSGDLGEFDEDGYLTITGRKKDLIITAGGKNISPQNIESGLKSDPLVSQVVVIGDRRKFLSALITLDEEAIKPWAAKQGLSETGAAAIAESDAMHKYVADLVERVNRDLSQVERVKKFTIIPTDFTQKAGEITPTLKVRRHKIEQHYDGAIEAMYD